MVGNFLKSVMAGIMIAVGGTIYLSVENPVIGAFLFAMGLFTICCFGFNLFTGKVGYTLDNKPSYLLFLILVWIGNFFGAFIVGTALRYTRISKISEKASTMCETKLNDSIVSILILSVFCGFLMYIGVELYKKIDGSGRYIGIFVCVVVFILSCFEHCVANMFYFTIAGAWSLKAFIYLLIMTLGNGIGGLLIPASHKLSNVCTKK